MNNKTNQNTNNGMDMEMAAKAFGTVFENLFGNNASVVLVDIVPTPDIGKGQHEHSKKSMPIHGSISRAKMVREHIMRDMLVADYCEELTDDMIALACMVELMENIFADVTKGKLSKEKAQKLFSEVSQLKSEITEKWSAFYAEGT